MPAVQNKAFTLAGLLTNVNPENLPKPDIPHWGAMTNDDIPNLKRPGVHEVKAGITVPANASSSFSHRGDVGSFNTITYARAREFLESIKKGISPGFSDSIKKGAQAVNYGSFVVQSFAFFRCSAFSLRLQASSTHAEKLAAELSALSSSTLASISSIRSCGKRIPTREDLLFLFPVAITDNLINIFGERTPYIKGERNKMLDVGAHQTIKWLHTLSTGKAQEVSKKTKPRGALTPSGLLTTTVITSNEAAMKNHTTHLQGRDSDTLKKFTWRFLAINRHDKKATPCRLSVEANTEHEARRILAPHFILSLSARLPVQEVAA